MPTETENVRFRGNIGSDLPKVKTTLMTQLRRWVLVSVVLSASMHVDWHGLTALAASLIMATG
jgi:hypothetical protein